MDRVQRGGPWTWGPCFVYVLFRTRSRDETHQTLLSSFEGSFLKVDKLIVNVQIYKGREMKDLIHYGAIM